MAGSVLGAAAGGIASGLASKILGGDAGSSMQQMRSFIQVPKEYEEDFNAMVDLSRDLFNRDFTAYTGDRNADFTPDQLLAFQGIRDLQGRYDPLLASATGLATTAANKFSAGLTPELISEYMNPYKQNVIDISKREAIRDYDMGLNALRSRNMAAGAFGGSRAALQESELNRNTAQLLDDLQYRGMSDAYDKAVATAMADREGTMSAAGSLANLAGLAQGVDLQGLQALGTSGEVQQALAQADADFDYSEFTRELGYDQERLQNFSDFMRDFAFVQVGQSRTTNNAGSPSLAAQMLGGATIGSQLLGGTSLSNLGAGFSNIFKPGGFSGGVGMANDLDALIGQGLGTLFKDGGHVKKYADGGRLQDTPWWDIVSEGAEGTSNPRLEAEIAAQLGLTDLESQFKTTAYKRVPDMVNYVKENPLEVLDMASTGLMMVPLLGPAMKGTSAGLKMLKAATTGTTAAGKAGAKGLSGLMARNPKATVFGAGLAGKVAGRKAGQGDAIPEEGIELPPEDVTDEVLAMDEAEDTAVENPMAEMATASGFALPPKSAEQMADVLPKKGAGPNKALLALGIGLMSTPGNFSQSLAAGMQGYMAQQEKEEIRSMEREKLARQAQQQTFDNMISLEGLELRRKEMEERSTYRRDEIERKFDAKSQDRLNRLDTQILNQQELLQKYVSSMEGDSEEALAVRKRIRNLELERYLVSEGINSVGELQAAAKQGRISVQQAKAIAIAKGWIKK